MKIEMRKLSDIKPYEQNPRVNDQAVDAVAASIREFGFRQPVVVDAQGVIVVGHTRWKAAQKLGLAEVPVHVAENLTPAQIKAYRLADIGDQHDALARVGAVCVHHQETRAGLAVPVSIGLGQTVRPSLVVLDDPQTDESARSLSQCATRERILAGAVLGLAGPGKKISGIMPCTVIRPGDMADNILDRDKHPEWNGERTKMVYRFPANERLWGKYAEVRAESLRVHGDMREASACRLKRLAALACSRNAVGERPVTSVCRPIAISAINHKKGAFPFRPAGVVGNKAAGI
jgi:hypothetical protein